MSYGLEIQNSSGNIIIDDKYANTLVNSSGIASKGSAAGFINQNSVFLGGDLLWASPYYSGTVAANDFIAVSYTWFNPGSGNIQLRSWCDGDYSALSDSQCADEIKWYRTSGLITPNPSTSGYGLEIYDENGNVNFTSNTGEFIEVVSSGRAIPGFGTAIFNAPAGENIRDYYVAVNNFFEFEESNVASYTRAFYDNTYNRILVTTNVLEFRYLIGKVIT
jgi:hypothetical protein